MAREQRKAIQCTLKHHLGKLRENEKGWSREVNIISWEGALSRLDIRDWSKGKDRSSKGITFTRAEVERLRDMLAILDLSAIEDSGTQMRVQDVQLSYQTAQTEPDVTTPLSEVSNEAPSDDVPFEIEEDEQQEAV